MSTPGYRPGDFWRMCSRCGFRFRASQTYLTWDGLYVCIDDFETRHPQDFVRGRADQIRAPNPRPEPEPVFVTGTDYILTEDGAPIQTEGGVALTVE